MAASADDRYAGQDLFVAAWRPRSRPRLGQAQLVLLVRRLEPRVRRRARTPTPRPGRRSARAGMRGSPSAVRNPPAWSKWRWLTATMSTVSGSKPACAARAGSSRRVRPDARAASRPCTRRCRSRSGRGRRASRPSRQLSAWVSVLSGLISASTSRCHMIRGTGPKTVPASDVNVPAWIERDGHSPAEIGAPVDRSRYQRSRRGRPLADACGRRVEVLGRTATRSGSTGPGTWNRARASRTAARPRWTS